MVRILWIVFSLFIVYGVLIPFHLCIGIEAMFSNIASISWIPFMDSDGTRASIPDVVQNILLFLPFGFFGFLSMARKKTIRILLITCIGALFSVSIEVLQLFTCDRTTSVTDFVTNTTGTFLGALAAFTALLIFSEIIASSSFRRYCHAFSFYPLMIACAIVVLGTLQPFDFTLDVGSVWPKVKAFMHDPCDFSLIFRDEGVVFLRFVLFAYVGAFFFQENTHKYSTIKGMLMSSIIGVFLEGSQFIIASRMPTSQDVAIVLLGSLCGGLLAVISKTITVPRIFWGILSFLATSVSVGVQLLSPFRIAEEYRGFNWLPFLPYYERTTFVALSNFIESMLMYFPMGFLLQYFLLRRRRYRFFFLGLLTLGIAFSFESLQGWIVNRYPDITDVLGALAGVLAGSWCCLEGWAAFDRYVKKVSM